MTYSQIFLFFKRRWKSRFFLFFKWRWGKGEITGCFSQRDCCCCCYCWVASVVSDSVRPHRQQPTRLPRPWDSPGKKTGVGCHFLLQCMKVKSESEDAQSCLTLSDPMDCSPPGCSIHGTFQARVLEWGAIAFSTRDWEEYNNNNWDGLRWRKRFGRETLRI